MKSTRENCLPILTNASIVNTSPRSILVFSGRLHIISNVSIANNCYIIYHLNKQTIQLKFIKKHNYGNVI